MVKMPALPHAKVRVRIIKIEIKCLSLSKLVSLPTLSTGRRAGRGFLALIR